jgi:hypothetical protein
MRARTCHTGVALAGLSALNVPVGVAAAQGGSQPWKDASRAPEQRVLLLALPGTSDNGEAKR